MENSCRKHKHVFNTLLLIRAVSGGGLHMGRSLLRVTYCHHRGGRSPSLRAGGRASLLGPPAGVSACSWATWNQTGGTRTSTPIRYTLHLNFLFLKQSCSEALRHRRSCSPLCPSSAASGSSTAPSWRSSRGTWPSPRGASGPAPTPGPAGPEQNLKFQRITVRTTDEDENRNVHFSFLSFC